MWSPIRAESWYLSSPPITFLVFSIIIFTVTEIICLESANEFAKRSTKTYRHATGSSNNNNGQTDSTNQAQTDSSGRGGGGVIYLESLDDLEHVAYLAMRNFNITDESLIQSNWNTFGGNIVAHKTHQKVVDPSQASTDGNENENGNGGGVGSPMNAANESNNKDRLALMLESFILHLRNGHLRQLELEELREIVGSGAHLLLLQPKNQFSDNITAATAATRAAPNTSAEENAIKNSGMNDRNVIGSPVSAEWQVIEPEKSPAENSDIGSDDLRLDESHERCQHLVNLYAQEIRERHKSSSSSAAAAPNQQQTAMSEQKSDTLTNSRIVEGGKVIPFDQIRLLKLCRLVVRCHSADDLVGLLDGPWYDDDRDNPKQNYNPADRSWAKSNHSSDDNDDSLLGPAEPTYRDYPPATSGRGSNQQPRSLRDSLSQSLAKLCPLMLFQLHDEDGMCNFRRDDRPPMITVWGFATLFVTIVSFVSLIGLSITPLLGPSANSTSSDSNSDLSTAGLMNQQRHHHHSRSLQSHHRHHHSSSSNGNNNNSSNNKRQHRACLTLFEGLAVGSLVGSALFSLIPQAFELQERESNQGFLLKALIIFFGIYLFFCSERIMRIILDTKQYRKRNRRSSTGLAPASTTVDNLAGNGGFATASTTAFSAIRRQQPEEQRQRRRHSKPAAGNEQVSGAAVKSSRSRLSRYHQQSSEIELGKCAITSNKCVNFPSSRVVAGTVEQPSRRDQLEGRRSRRREKISSSKDAGGGGGATGKSARQVGERRQAARRHSARTQRSVVAASSGSLRQRRRQKRRKTRYQLLVQSKRLQNDSPTFTPRGQLLDRTVAAKQQQLPLRKRLGSLSVSDDDNLTDTSVHESGSLAEESYDSTTSLDSSSSQSSSSSPSSSSDSDDLSDYRLSSRLRQQHVRPTGQPSRTRRRTHEQNGNGLLESSPHFSINNQALYGQVMPRGQNMMPVINKRPNVRRSPPREKREISTVAWMIVLGDGLHNFIDGISIGAAFSESILSGVSISVAVICEEFPHELGDFAVLVSSGMTVRQALGYNFLSACTCYLGMAVGIILGDVNDGASYISALAAGVFLYIALVDMMGELSASLEESSRDSIGKTLKLLLLQNVGIFIGISIILVLSFIDF